MGRHYAIERDWRSLDSDLQRDVEASAAHILQRIGPATVERIESLAALAAAEAAHASTRQGAETAFALSAALKRRARMLQH